MKHPITLKKIGCKTANKITRYIFIPILTLGALTAEVLHVPSQYSSIQDGLDNAAEGDTVLVAPGIYYEQIYWPSYTQDIKLIGSGVETTIIDGNQVETVIIIPFSPGSAPLDTNTVVKGFTIRNGYALKGAGVRVIRGSPILEDLLITDNVAYYYNSLTDSFGAGLYISSDSGVIVRNVTIRNNVNMGSFYSSGGGVYCRESSPTFINVTVRNNVTFTGGGSGMYFLYSTPLLVNVTITENGSEDEEGNPNGGRAVSLEDSGLNMFNVVISNNLVGGLGISNNSHNSVIDGNFSTVIEGNVATTGPGIVVQNSDQTVIIRNLIIRNNETADTFWPSGGGLFCEGNWDNKLILDHVEISDNFAESNGGIKLRGANLEMVNCTVTGNSSAMYSANGVFMRLGSTLTVRNSIIWDNEYIQLMAGHLGWDVDSIAVSYSLVEDGEEGIVYDYEYPVINWGAGNLDTDPLFLNPAAGDYRLQPDSPCIDAGDPSDPFDPDSTVVDMGRYFYDQTFYLFGDINNDNEVNILDILRFVEIIHGDEPTETEMFLGDVNQDSSLDILDILLTVNIILGG